MVMTKATKSIFQYPWKLIRMIIMFLSCHSRKLHHMPGIYIRRRFDSTGSRFSNQLQSPFHGTKGVWDAPFSTDPSLSLSLYVNVRVCISTGIDFLDWTLPPAPVASRWKVRKELLAWTPAGANAVFFKLTGMRDGRFSL